MTSLLPTEKTPASIDPLRKKILLYGQPKIGKSTLVNELDPTVLNLATEPGLDALEVYRVDVRSWSDFLSATDEIAKQVEAGKFQHKLISVDTVDALAAFCNDHVLSALGGGGRNRFIHASDFEYGKGWSAIEQEFKLRVARLCNLGVGVVFVAHMKEGEVKLANGLTQTKLGPDVGQKGIRKWLLGFVDVILMADLVPDEGGKEKRILRTQPTTLVEAGGRLKGNPPTSIAFKADTLKAFLTKFGAA